MNNIVRKIFVYKNSIYLGGYILCVESYSFFHFHNPTMRSAVTLWRNAFICSTSTVMLWRSAVILWRSSVILWRSSVILGKSAIISWRRVVDKNDKHKMNTQTLE
jgi:hypothetical protein